MQLTVQKAWEVIREHGTAQASRDSTEAEHGRTSAESKATVKRQQLAKLDRMDCVLLKELGW